MATDESFLAKDGRIWYTTKGVKSKVKGIATLKTAIVTDTNSSITPQEAKEMGIYLIPMPFFIDGETYLEGETCTHETFFHLLKAGAKVSTSQPSPETLTSLWDRLLQTYDRVLHFPMSSGLRDRKSVV